MSQQYFKYGEREIEYLKSKDKILAKVIDKIGKIERVVTPDLFEALIHTIIGQQISIKAQESIWNKMKENLPAINSKYIANASAEHLQSLGLSFRKVEYMQDIAKKIEDKKLDLNKFYEMNDNDVCTELSKLRGIGVWSAEMLMLFSMQRPNILSFGDLAIQRGLRMIYHHRKITPELYRKYYRRYTPYSSVASLYIWAVAGGAIPEMRDYKPKGKV